MTSQQPTGFRFLPTEKELVVDYLRPKIFKCLLPCDDIIPVKNIYLLNPEQLSDSEIGVYFFTLRKKKYPNGSYSNRVVADGYWSSRRISNYIYNDKEKVGKRNLLKYMKVKNETHWLMDEYELIDKNKEGQLEEDWVICKIHKSKSKSKKHTSSTKGEIPVELQGIRVDEGPNISQELNNVLPDTLLEASLFPPLDNSQQFMKTCMDEGLGSSRNDVDCELYLGPTSFHSYYNSQKLNDVLPENISSDNPQLVDLQFMKTCMDEGPGSSGNEVDCELYLGRRNLQRLHL